eukprot:2504759-Lingulodinium_polyedra.AAC.1
MGVPCRLGASGQRSWPHSCVVCGSAAHPVWQCGVLAAERFAGPSPEDGQEPSPAEQEADEAEAALPDPRTRARPIEHPRRPAPAGIVRVEV